MRARKAAWALWAVAVSLAAGTLILGLANHLGAPLYENWVTLTIITTTFATLGALVVSRRPGNSIGWIFLVASVAFGVHFFSGQYAVVALAPNGPALPGAAVAAWLSNLVQAAVLFGGFLFLVLLFPTGRLLSPRWRVLAWVAALAVAATLVYLALAPGPIEAFPYVRNPFGIEDAAAVELLGTVGIWTALFCFVAAIVSLVLRFYRSRGEERLQLKWFTYAATVGFLTIMLGNVFAPAALEGQFGALVWTIAPLSLPVAVAIAILKYRLYDIDRIINRTLVYGLLTAMLVLVYVSSVFSFQYVFRTLAGEASQLVVVASTLAIAALFSPLRWRIQDFIDRRFYRGKYDAARTLEAFSGRLRDETDLNTLSDDLVGVVRETMQPEHVSLWLKPAGTVRRTEEQDG
ncbi:MAG TPA: hypothetical protein VGP38_00790 [Rubrobacter sp.]|nr:hypothetical protein [Rubrobacter sp.]